MTTYRAYAGTYIHKLEDVWGQGCHDSPLGNVDYSPQLCEGIIEEGYA